MAQQSLSEVPNVDKFPVVSLYNYRKRLFRRPTTEPKKAPITDFLRSNPDVNGARTIFAAIKHLATKKRDVTVVFYLNRDAPEKVYGKVFGIANHNECLSRTKEIIYPAKNLEGVNSMVVCTSHGRRSTPTKRDLEVTKQLEEEGFRQRVWLVERVIFTPTLYYSFFAKRLLMFAQLVRAGAI